MKIMFPSIDIFLKPFNRIYSKVNTTQPVRDLSTRLCDKLRLYVARAMQLFKITFFFYFLIQSPNFS